MAPQRDPDEHVIAHMASLGWDLDVPRTIQHFIVGISTEQEAAELAADLSDAGYAVRHHPTPRASTWSIQADLRQIIEIEAIRSQRAEMEGLAERCGATYDGWGAAQS